MMYVYSFISYPWQKAPTEVHYCNVLLMFFRSTSTSKILSDRIDAFSEMLVRRDPGR